jgi:hypothetical protein
VELTAVTITRIGTNQKYAEGWEKAFSGKKGTAKAAQKPSAKKAGPSKKAKAGPKKAARKAKR